MTHSEKTPNKYQIAAYILAGGKSQRFSGEIKGLQQLKDKPLLAHVIDRLKPQIDKLHINSHLAGFDSFALPIIADDPSNLYNGPLSGLLACMHHMHIKLPEKDWLLIAPCDAPLLPADLVECLCEKLTPYKAACISYENYLQPTFSIWHKSLLTHIETAVNENHWGGLKIFIEHISADVKIVNYPVQTINPFMNINTQEELNDVSVVI